jgi:hypothetical protein
VLLTRSPLILELPPRRVRLACVRHAANVHSEPGSNSPVDKITLASYFRTEVMANWINQSRSAFVSKI